MRNLRTLTRMGDDLVVVKEDLPADGEARLYVAATMSKQIGASLNAAQVRGLHETLGAWLVENGEAKPAPTIEILHSRDPDSECVVTVWVDGKLTEVCEEDIDPGRGYEREDVEARIEDVKASEAMSDDFKAATLEALTSGAFSRYGTGGWDE